MSGDKKEFNESIINFSRYCYVEINIIYHFLIISQVLRAVSESHRHFKIEEKVNEGKVIDLYDRLTAL